MRRVTPLRDRSIPPFHWINLICKRYSNEVCFLILYLLEAPEGVINWE